MDGTPLEARTEAIGSAALADLTFDVYSHVIRSFGPSRCMFESNFPVDRQSLPYAVLWNAMQIMASDYSASEQADLFVGTAARTYRIGMDG